jgi:hypothetical protein
MFFLTVVHPVAVFAGFADFEAVSVSVEVVAAVDSDKTVVAVLASVVIVIVSGD